MPELVFRRKKINQMDLVAFADQKKVKNLHIIDTKQSKMNELQTSHEKHWCIKLEMFPWQ